MSQKEYFMASLKHFQSKSLRVWFCHTKNTPVNTNARTSPRPHTFFGTSRSDTVNAAHMPNQAIHRERRQWIRTRERSKDSSAMIIMRKMPNTVL